jgi:uncharacterized protein
MTSSDKHSQIIDQTVAFVQETLQNAEGGHDWHHIQRVWNSARMIASHYTECNLLVVELSALLHDIADSKFHNGDESMGPKVARSFLNKIGVNERIITDVVTIVENISFKGGHHTTTTDLLEFYIVQDADRLDAIGAIGIARTFNYGGYKGNALYDPKIRPQIGMSKEEYKKGNQPTINHFYEKLLLLKDLINTEKGKELAQQRHEYMEQFLAQFYAEWNGER